MTRIALWLYAIAFLLSFILGGPSGLMYFFPVFALLVTAVLGIVHLLLLPLARWVFSMRSSKMIHENWR
jgi:hypothetical protein